MKKNIKRLFLGITICLFGFGIFLSTSNADSGWDSDYDSSSSWDSGSSWDSDSSWDSGSSWDSDSSWHSSSSSSSGDPIIGFIIMAFVIITLIIKVNNVIKRNSPNDNNSTSISAPFDGEYKDLSIDSIREVDPNLDINEFKKKTFDIYKNIQVAWMNFDTSSIRKMTTDEIYNMYSSQLETLKLKGQKNIIKDISLIDSKIVYIEKIGNIITTNVYMKVRCYDYVIKEATGEVVRGNDKNMIVIEYMLSFVKSASDSKLVEKCPNCGANIDIHASSTCPYCDSTLVKDSGDYVMSKKCAIRQYNERL